MTKVHFAAMLAGILALQAFDVSAALAQGRDRGGGGADRQVRRDASASVNRGANAGANRNVNANANRNVNASANRNVNVNNNVNVNGSGCCNNGYNDWDDDYRPGAALAAVAVTAAVVGSVTRSVPPSCVTTVVNGVSYSQCGSTWYQPRYSGSSVEYVVVSPPQ
jgi:hypothetical protein